MAERQRSSSPSSSSIVEQYSSSVSTTVDPEDWLDAIEVLLVFFLLIISVVDVQWSVTSGASKVPGGVEVLETSDGMEALDAAGTNEKLKVLAGLIEELMTSRGMEVTF